jgi:nucleotide-binding universal stress UspA family protein
VKLLTLQTILVATDLDEGSRPALVTARELAESAGAAVHVVHVSDDRGALEAMSATLGELGLPPEDASLHVVPGEAAHAVNVLADRIGADAILLGPHRARREVEGRGVLGSTALALVTNASVPCMVVTRALRIPVQRTLAAVDVSDSTRGTLAVALTWTSALRRQGDAGEHATVLTVLHVSRPPTDSGRPSATSRKLDTMLEQLRGDAGNWAGAEIQSVTTENADPATGIVAYATEIQADMVVLGTRGLGVDSVGRIGSVSAAVMKNLEVPALLVPPAMWMELARTT